MAGPLRVVLTTPNTDDGAVMFQVAGVVDSVVAPAGLTLFQSVPGPNVIRAIVTGNIATGQQSPDPVRGGRQQGVVDHDAADAGGRAGHLRAAPDRRVHACRCRSSPHPLDAARGSAVSSGTPFRVGQMQYTLTINGASTTWTPIPTPRSSGSCGTIST